MRRFLFCLTMWLSAFAVAQPLAFPGAEGFGKHAVGGRGGRTIIVTNLDDSGPGQNRCVCGEWYYRVEYSFESQ